LGSDALRLLRLLFLLDCFSRAPLAFLHGDALWLISVLLACEPL
jgi:hypothetical protein